uniref:Tetraspanin 33 n=1 Tax=Taeniopygia guttata TaxID=59729 RepID=A0A674HA44_TAEGU
MLFSNILYFEYFLIFQQLFKIVISMLMVAVGCTPGLLKHAEAAMACLAVDPSCQGWGPWWHLGGPLTFSICLTIIFLLQLAPAPSLLSPFVPQARGKVSEIINGAIVHYRDDLDLQNLIDFGRRRGDRVVWVGVSLQLMRTCPHVPGSPACSVPCPLSQAVINTMCGHGMQARGYLEASAFIHTNGCIDKLVNWTHSNLFLLGGITLGLALPQLVGIVLARLLINQLRDQIKLQLYNQQHRADPWS